ncbi:MAG: phosphate ABC transporter substrate-binding protein, partial [Gammaproteobacteria bacterium]
GAGSASSDEVSRVFLGKSSSLGGASVTPVDQSSGSASREAFYKAVVGKSGGELKSYWARQTFTGKGQPPKERGDDRAVKAYVASNPGAVGYVDSSVVDASVKVILKV